MPMLELSKVYVMGVSSMALRGIVSSVVFPLVGLIKLGASFLSLTANENAFDVETPFEVATIVNLISSPSVSRSHASTKLSSFVEASNRSLLVGLSFRPSTTSLPSGSVDANTPKSTPLSSFSSTESGAIDTDGTSGASSAPVTSIFTLIDVEYFCSVRLSVATISNVSIFCSPSSRATYAEPVSSSV